MFCSHIDPVLVRPGLGESKDSGACSGKQFLSL